MNQKHQFSKDSYVKAWWNDHLLKMQYYLENMVADKFNKVKNERNATEHFLAFVLTLNSNEKARSVTPYMYS